MSTDSLKSIRFRDRTASEGLAASVWRAHAEEIDVSVWRRRWAPTEADETGKKEDLQVLHCSSRGVI